MTDVLLIGVLAAALAGALFAALGFFSVRRYAGQAPLGRIEAGALLRNESDLLRSAMDANARGLREELGRTLAQNQGATLDTLTKLSDSLRKQVGDFGTRLEASNRITETRIDDIGNKLNTDIEQMAVSATGNRDALRLLIEQKLDASVAAHADAATRLREELNGSFQRMRQIVSDTLTETSNHQKERLDATKSAIADLTQKQAQVGEQLRQTVEGRLDLLRTENTAELEKVRATVDEKLQTTLEKRLDESFGRVVDQLNKAYEVFGEMRSISASVGDLKNVLTNPKLRGTFGEVQLGMLLQDFLSPHQYIKDAQVKEGSAERVEFAIRLPTVDGEDMLLPVDAKFPRDDHERMIAAQETGDPALVEHFRKQLEGRIKTFAKDICRKYINPPRTTDRAILFLPTESLFAEVLRQPGLFDYLLRECNVMLAGPTTFAAILHSFQVNYRSMAIAQQSGEVWKILSAVRTEFRKYNETVSKVARQLNTAAGSVSELGNRTRLMDRALKNVEAMPDDGRSTKLLGLDDAAGESDGAASEPIVFPGSPEFDAAAVSAATEEVESGRSANERGILVGKRKASV
jgi:DNA recombination protein RmuC